MSRYHNPSSWRRGWQQGNWRYWDEAEIDQWNEDHPNHERQWQRQTDTGNTWIDDLVDWIKDFIYN